MQRFSRRSSKDTTRHGYGTGVSIYQYVKSMPSTENFRPSIYLRLLAGAASLGAAALGLDAAVCLGTLFAALFSASFPWEAMGSSLSCSLCFAILSSSFLCAQSSSPVAFSVAPLPCPAPSVAPLQSGLSVSAVPL